MAHRMGSGIGGILNATFGNAAGLIIAIVALRAGQVEMVKASITGSIIGNILFVLGAAMLVGGIGRTRQTFNAQAAGTAASMMLLAVAALILPTFFHFMVRNETIRGIQRLSAAIAVVLLLTYLLGLVFALKTHKYLYTDAGEVVEEGSAPGGVAGALVTLVVTTVLIAVLIVNSIAADGESNWLEGAMLLATYLILGIAFYLLP
jgi:Ca2+:H+ antiporter